MYLSDKVHTLVVSSNRGRYACDDSEHGHDLTSGERCAILLANQWVHGYIEYGPAYSVNVAPGKPMQGYYFTSDIGEQSVGLCVGMKVKLYER